MRIVTRCPPLGSTAWQHKHSTAQHDITQHGMTDAKVESSIHLITCCVGVLKVFAAGWRFTRHEF
jgi:hypothetical protein